MSIPLYTHVCETDESATDTLLLPFEARQKARQRVRLESGEEIGMRLPRGLTVRGGDRLASPTHPPILIQAADETVSTVHCENATALARLAYHLGNRHVWLEVGDGWVRYLADSVLDDMVRQMGHAIVSESAPFEPEAGAYHGHSHGDSHSHSHSHGHATQRKHGAKSASTPAKMIRLWQLISPTLPIGSYSYSQALEYAVDAEWVKDEDGTQRWIEQLLAHTLTYVDLPLINRLHKACIKKDESAFVEWNAVLLASRETAELRNEEREVGTALRRLLADLSIEPPIESGLSYAAAFATVAAQWGIAVEDACAGFAWAWCESRVAAAIKLVPLGHSAGQRVLASLSPTIDCAVQTALALEDDEIGSSAYGFAIGSAQHETQYTRLFRS